jgi:hypothetical protein
MPQRPSIEPERPSVELKRLFNEPQRLSREPKEPTVEPQRPSRKPLDGSREADSMSSAGRQRLNSARSRADCFSGSSTPQSDFHPVSGTSKESTPPHHNRHNQTLPSSGENTPRRHTGDLSSTIHPSSGENTPGRDNCGGGDFVSGEWTPRSGFSLHSHPAVLKAYLLLVNLEKKMQREGRRFNNVFNPKQVLPSHLTHDRASQQGKLTFFFSFFTSTFLPY